MKKKNQKNFVLVILTLLPLQSSVKYTENPTELKYQGGGTDRLEDCIDFPSREIEFFF